MDYAGQVIDAEGNPVDVWLAPASSDFDLFGE